MKARGLPVVGNICTNSKAEKLFRDRVLIDILWHGRRKEPMPSKKEIDAVVAKAKKVRLAVLKRSNELMPSPLQSLRRHLAMIPPQIVFDDKKLQALRKKHKTQVAKCKGKVLKKCPNGCGFDHLTVWVSFKKKYLLCPQCGWSSRPIAQAYFKRRGAKL